MTRAAAEIAALVRALDFGPATFYGCSSGGHIALCLAAEHRDLVRKVVVHEVAGLATVHPARSPTELDDDAERALRTLEASGMSQSEAIRSALLASARRVSRGRELSAEVPALEAGEGGPGEIAARPPRGGGQGAPGGLYLWWGRVFRSHGWA